MAGLATDRLKLARILFSLDAVLGIVAIGGAALYGAAYSPKSPWLPFISILLPGAALWGLFCYGAFRGLTGKNALCNVLFWLFVVGHFFAFPVGTAISGACLWLRSELGKTQSP